MIQPESTGGISGVAETLLGTAYVVETGHMAVVKASLTIPR
jgi:hypothetical protein